MSPLTLEDETERACLFQNAREQFVGRRFWISAARDRESDVNKWCLKDSKESSLLVNVSNMRLEFMEKFENDDIISKIRW